MSPKMQSCQARILYKEFKIPGTSESCHTTKECGETMSRKITIDDGDATLSICSTCLKRFMTKSSPTSNWYGWFDCDYPPEARVKYSKWYNEKVAVASAHQIASAPQITAIKSKREIVREILQRNKAAQKEEILEKIAEATAWMNGEGKKESIRKQCEKSKEIMKLKTALRMLS